MTDIIEQRKYILMSSFANYPLCCGIQGIDLINYLFVIIIVNVMSLIIIYLAATDVCDINRYLVALTVNHNLLSSCLNLQRQSVVRYDKTNLSANQYTTFE